MQGCIMLDPSVTVEDRAERDAPMPSGTSDLGPFIFDVEASERAAAEGVTVFGRLLTPLESGDNACDDLNVGDYAIEVDLYHPGSDQHWTRTYTRTSCRGYVAQGDLPCDAAGPCSGRFELRAHGEGLTSSLETSVWLRAAAYFDDGATRGDATLTVMDVTPD